MSDLEALVLVALGFLFAGVSAFAMLWGGPDSSELESRWEDVKASESRLDRAVGTVRVGAWATGQSLLSVILALMLLGVSVLVVTVVGGAIGFVAYGLVLLVQLVAGS